MAATRSGYAAPQTVTSARVFTILAFVFAVVALFFLPIVLGPIAAVLGFIGFAKGDRLGLWAGLAAIAATIVGILLAYVLMEAMNNGR